MHVQSVFRVGVADKTSLFEMCRKMQSSVTGKTSILGMCP